MPKAAKGHSTNPFAKPQNYDPRQAESCPVVALHKKMQGMLEARNELMVEFDEDSETIKDLLRELYDAHEGFNNVATFTAASSVEGAMVQLSILRDRARLMFDGIPGQKDQDALAPVHRTIERLLYSIAGVMRAVVGDQVANHVFSGDFHSSDNSVEKIEHGATGKPIGPLIHETYKKEYRAAARQVTA